MFIDLWSSSDSLIVKLNAFILIRKIASLCVPEFQNILKVKHLFYYFLFIYFYFRNPTLIL